MPSQHCLPDTRVNTRDLSEQEESMVKEFLTENGFKDVNDAKPALPPRHACQHA